MTPAELAQVRERADNATPGPWTRNELYGDLCGPNGEELFYGDDVDGTVWASELDDAIFATHAREDIPNLLDHIDWQQKQFERVLDGLKNHSARLWAIRELHQPIPNWNAHYCAECNTGRDLVNDEAVPYPCPTITALDGTPPDEPHVPYLDN